jgi:HD-GYP domain-containing protein (c-di-GMP phosphodiesterase class II)
MKHSAVRRFEQVNKELWILLSLFLIALLLNHVVASQRMVLGFYVLPTLGSAYLYGKREATLTAFASVLMVVLLLMYGDAFYPGREPMVEELGWTKWLDVTVWGGSLLVTGYLMGTLCERKNLQLQELRDTYHGVLMILRHFISKDAYTENHCHRVSVYATTIAATMELSPAVVEDVKAAALLHDIGKLDISRDLL